MEYNKRSVNETTLLWNDLAMSLVFGRFTDTPYKAVDHSHLQYEMFLFKSCSGKMTVGGDTFRITDDSAVIVAPGVRHSMESFADEPLVGMTISFSYKKISSTKYESSEKLFALFDESMKLDKGYVILKNSYFGSFCKEVEEEQESNPLIASVLIKHLFEGLFIKVLRCINERSNNGGIPLYSYTSYALSNDLVILIKLDNYMNEPGCTLTSLANKLDMSPRNVQRIIKNRYGMSFSSRLANLRISRALKLFSDESLSLFEIAERCGYNRYDSFRKAFVAKMGVSPTDYRKKYIEQ